jgi:type I restriction enzyme S subunit
MIASEDQLREFSVTYGDILFQRSSETVEDIGQANVYLDNKPCLFGGFVIRGKKKADYNPLYMKYALKAPINRKKVIIKGAGAQHYNIGQENLFFDTYFYCGKEEQAKISSLLSDLRFKNRCSKENH